MQMHIGSNRGGVSRSGSAAGGSLWLSEIGWRDMWAMVAKHFNVDPETDDNNFDGGGHVYGESYSRNPGLIMQHNTKGAGTSSSWGSDVMLRVQVPLDVNYSQNQSKCIVIQCD